ncbi:MAG: polyprenol monophosphomannose synthase [Candidatus Thorarchaeota archaeon]|jgi:dolichol-phosphate mannosyltransferase
MTDSHVEKIGQSLTRGEGLAMRTVIVPTLNEEENIEPLVRSIFQHLGNDGVSVIIVDDNSSDGTHDSVRRLTEEYDGLRMIIRTDERGLASAVREGARWANDGPVAVMDADLSHDPRFLRRLFEKLEEGYDVVVGSRYIKGGKIVGWPGSRMAISKGATKIAKILLRVPITDPMSGFVACRSNEFLTSEIEHADFKFLLELLTRNRKLRVAEVPIVFLDRRRGKSKLDENTILLFLGLVFRLIFRLGRNTS